MKVLTIITLTQHVRCSMCTGTFGAGTLLPAPVLCSGLRKNEITLRSSMLKKGTILTLGKRPGLPVMCHTISWWKVLLYFLMITFTPDSLITEGTCRRPVGRSSACACQNTTKERSSLGTRAPCFMSCCLQREVWHIRPNAALLCGSVGGLEDKERCSLSNWKLVLTTFNRTYFLGSKSEIKPLPMRLN